MSEKIEAHCNNCGGERNHDILHSEKKEWINWAKEKADWYDPFVEKDLELLKNIDRDTLKPIKKSFFN